MDIGQRPQHGGNLAAFAREQGRRPDQCLDLSTGISPWAWPVPEVPVEVWQKLPGCGLFDAPLLQAASACYQCPADNLLAVSGSQAAIEAIPRMPGQEATVALPRLGYEEHAYCWQRAGARLCFYGDHSELAALVDQAGLTHAVVINPNNPTTEKQSLESLAQMAGVLAARQGFLLVDEAFADPEPDNSLMPEAGMPGLVVLRSLGKFFGLPGVRLGFVGAGQGFLAELADSLGLWPVNSAALYLGAKMLADTDWIVQQRMRLVFEAAQMQAFLQARFPELDWRRTDLFVAGRGPVAAADACRQRFAEAGIAVRCFVVSVDQALVRVGLANETGKQMMDNL